MVALKKVVRAGVLLAGMLVAGNLAPAVSHADKQIDANKAVVRRYLEELVSQKKLAVADEIIAPDYVYHGRTGPDGARKGPEVVKEFVGMYIAAFPDLHLALQDIIAEGDRVAARFVATGTHKGPLGEMAATGASVKVDGILICRIQNGKVAEEWEVFDEMQMMSQLEASAKK